MIVRIYRIFKILIIILSPRYRYLNPARCVPLEI